MKHHNALLFDNICVNVFILFIVTAVTFSQLVSADSTATTTISGQPASDDFGRLFTPQYERNAIDRARLTGGHTAAQITGIDEANTSAAATESAQPVKLLGVLLRADGKNKVWFSGLGKSQTGNINSAIMGNIRQSANVKVNVNRGAILKPGQVWSLSTGRQEAYQLPVPKPVISEPVFEPEQHQSTHASSSAQTSSVTSSEVHSSVQSSAK